MPDFVVRRTLELPGMQLELRVTAATAVRWCPEHKGNPRLLAAAADGHAVREAQRLVREREVPPGRWRITWDGPESVFEPM